MKGNRESERYESVATYLLNKFASEFGLACVEGKQSMPGQATDWVIDAKGVRAEDDGIVVVECRRYTTSKLKQEQLGGIAYKISDLGGVGGITVSPFDLQKGANKIAENENIIHVNLNPDATTAGYLMKFLGNVMVGVAATTAHLPIRSLKTKVEGKGEAT